MSLPGASCSMTEQSIILTKQRAFATRPCIFATNATFCGTQTTFSVTKIYVSVVKKSINDAEAYFAATAAIFMAIKTSYSKRKITAGEVLQNAERSVSKRELYIGDRRMEAAGIVLRPAVDFRQLIEF